jgi:hypothetical protein
MRSLLLLKSSKSCSGSPRNHNGIMAADER